MQRNNGKLIFSATDISSYLECERVLWLDRRALDDADMRALKLVAKSLPGNDLSCRSASRSSRIVAAKREIPSSYTPNIAAQLRFF